MKGEIGGRDELWRFYTHVHTHTFIYRIHTAIRTCTHTPPYRDARPIHTAIQTGARILAHARTHTHRLEKVEK